MSPNGLRRWRRYAKKCRYRSRKEGKVSNATGASLRALFFAARIHPNYAVPPKPFTARSLVGMTMGAKKRTWSVKAGYSRPEISSFRPLLGQKLRPCPGCWMCDTVRTCIGCGNRETSDDCEVCVTYQRERFVFGCDGSGVLPARKEKP